MHDKTWHEVEIRVRFAETDIYGLVHHSNFFVWFEIGRIEYLRHLGLTLEDFSKEDISLVLRECSCRAHSPIRNDEKVTIRTRLAEITPVKIVFQYELVNVASGKVAVTGRSMNAFVDSAGRIRRLDAGILEKLS